MFSLLLGEIAGALGGGLLDQMGDIGEGIGGFMDDPGGSMMDAMKDTDLAALITDPENYMNKQIQDFTDKQGRAPSSGELASLKKQWASMRNQALSNMQLPTGGFINQNPNFLNTSQQMLG